MSRVFSRICGVLADGSSSTCRAFRGGGRKNVRVRKFVGFCGRLGFFRRPGKAPYAGFCSVKGLPASRVSGPGFVACSCGTFIVVILMGSLSFARKACKFLFPAASGDRVPHLVDSVVIAAGNGQSGAFFLLCIGGAEGFSAGLGVAFLQQ